MVSPIYYQIVFLLFTFLISLVISGSLWGNSSQDGILNKRRSVGWMWIVVLILIFYIGLRPRHSLFGDSSTYEDFYNSLSYMDIDWHKGDWLFNLLMIKASPIMEWKVFAFLIAAVYVMGQWIACQRMVSGGADVMMVFCLGALSFWGYAVNGLRNGMACSLVLVALSFLIQDKPKVVLFVIISFVAVSIHKSVLLPAASALLAFYYRNPKVMFYVWFISIPLSLVAGSAVEGFLLSFEADDRLASYLSEETKDEYAYLFSNTGFRWDFLLYSFMPILLGWYVIFKRKIIDWKYNILLATYMYSNSFWVMVIRASNSNRFAYLSWFLYPIVLSYPLLKQHVFKNNHTRKVAWVLMAHLLFTLFMYFKYNS